MQSSLVSYSNNRVIRWVWNNIYLISGFSILHLQTDNQLAKHCSSSVVQGSRVLWCGFGGGGGGGGTVCDCSALLINVLTGTKATPEQKHDLLNARAIGLQSYKNYVTHNPLQVPSVQSFLRQKQLLTMAPPKMTKRRLSEKETNSLGTGWRAWCNQTGQKYAESEEQYTILPRALADADSNPHSHQKSNWTEKLEKRYTIPETTPFLSSLPWV